MSSNPYRGMTDPWTDPKIFIPLFFKLRSWTKMANHFNDYGFKISEKTMRRVGNGLNLSLDDLEPLASEQPAEEKEILPAEIATYVKRDLKQKSEISHLRSVVSSLAKDGNTFDGVSRILKEAVDGLALPAPKRVQEKGATGEPMTMVGVWCDWHWGGIVDPIRVNGLNAFNPNIAARRVERFVDMHIAWKYNYERMGYMRKLVVMLNGDMFDAMSNIHPDEAVEYARVGKQLLDCALVTAQALYELAYEFEEIEVVCTAFDNHTRTGKRNSTSGVGVEMSFGTLYNEQVSSLLQNVDNVKFSISPSYQTFLEIEGMTFAVSHGQMIKGSGGMAGVPSAALAKHHSANLSRTILLAKQQDWSKIKTVDEALALLTGIVDVTIVSHFHNHHSMNTYGGKIIVAPSLKGTDSFTNDVISKYSPAEQLLMVVNSDHGIIGKHEINLQHIMEEGPTRYVWSALEDGTPTSAIFKNWKELRKAGKRPKSLDKVIEISV